MAEAVFFEAGYLLNARLRFQLRHADISSEIVTIQKGEVGFINFHKTACHSSIPALCLQVTTSPP